ncbi:ornithine cyclodeaminase family protein [Rhodoplanes azumiensis]|uniref:Ornithine cyclodeaminase family protein n=1 Tax=Rhodoplanes azumiensis TaxID=1897628 RepID=A0ABW5ALG9_9BRAD
MRLLSERDIERLIDPGAAIAAAAEAYRRQAAGEMPTPGRLDVLRTNPKGGALVLAGHSFDRRFVVKTNIHAYSDAAKDAAMPARTAASGLVLWDGVACVPLAHMATSSFNDHRTAAGFAAATQVLAPPAPHTLAVFGAGKIAPATVLYLSAVRRFARVVLVGRNVERARGLAAQLAARPELDGIDITVETDAATAATEADVIATVTTAETPIFPGDAVRSGTFVILGGANRPTHREVDDAFMRRARVFVDHFDGATTRAGDLALTLATGVLRPKQIVGEIGAFLDRGEMPPMPAGLDITVFKSIGIAAQDVITAGMVYERAVRDGIGLEFDMREGGGAPVTAPASHGPPR